MIKRHEVSKGCWENGTSRFAQFRITTNLQFVKNAVSAKHSKVKHNKVRYACAWFSELLPCLLLFENNQPKITLMRNKYFGVANSALLHTAFLC